MGTPTQSASPRGSRRRKWGLQGPGGRRGGAAGWNQSGGRMDEAKDLEGGSVDGGPRFSEGTD